ncbi:RseA family anti-sigma factor [Vibrio hepatarius]|uniref:RseA family anti-sigma factor n=1 Tax=Vibrio hepatarius TaxID=171383 RepID=UPI001C09DBCF|nr:RseA family anti-sigma factor [Vibrio hepatarius]MBU2897249.1 anti-sigma E factor [Vibrio hepatarius]
MADKEKISALMDGELVDKALISELEQDQSSLKTWSNYHLIGDAMRDEAPQIRDWCIADSVALALEKENTHTRLSLDNITEINQPSGQPHPVRARRELPAWLNQFGQVAVAACVSFVVILGVQQYGGSEPGQADVEQLPVLQTIPFTGSAEPVSLTRSSVDQPTPNSTTNVQEQRRRINAMLQDYELQLRLNSEVSDHNDNPETVVE